MEFNNKKIAEFILSNIELTGNDLFDYMKIPQEKRSGFLQECIINQFFKTIEQYDIKLKEVLYNGIYKTKQNF